MVRLSGVCTIIILLWAGCSGVREVQPAGPVTGRIERAALPEEFFTDYPVAPIDPPFIEMIRQARTGVRVLVFLGTWCSDSRRDVPRFLRIADETGMVAEDYVLYALDRKKTSTGGVERTYGIERVPTFVFLRGDREIGRIVEVPRTTLEGDILAILAAGGN